MDLYLFDIDGTLLDTVKVHTESFKTAYRKVFDIDVPESLFARHTGKTVMNFQRSVCSDLGLDFSDDDLKMIVREWTEHMKKLIKEGSVDILPGCRELVDLLNQNGDETAIITGNSSEIGHTLLEATGLLGHFDVRIYADGIDDRSELVRIAIGKVREKGINFEKLIVIGDTPHDVEAGKKFDAVTVAVETGGHDTKTLESSGADIVLKDMSDYKKILQRVSQF